MQALLTGLLLACAATSALMYFVVNRGRAQHFMESPIDRRIPFIPEFIIPYLAFIPLVTLAFALAFPTPWAVPFYLALIMGTLAGTLIRFFLRWGIRQPQIRREDVYDRLIHWLYRHDDRAHTFPSSHVLISTVASYYLALMFPPYALGIWAVGALVALSTLFVKQHYVIDVLGGVAFAAGAIYLTSLIV